MWIFPWGIEILNVILWWLWSSVAQSLPHPSELLSSSPSHQIPSFSLTAFGSYYRNPPQKDNTDLLFVHSFPSSHSAMPLVDIQSRLGINVDRWILLQSGEQPNKRPARCHAFEKEWVECSHGIGQTRAKKECQQEFEDFYECMHRQKTVSRFSELNGSRFLFGSLSSQYKTNLSNLKFDWSQLF